MRSLFSGVSGLLTHQTRMDVIGNNIANVNTVGFKASRVTFKDMLYETMRAATAPMGTRGGTNPQQVGLGVQLGSIDVLHTPGNLQPTGVTTDLAIRGNGLFVLLDGEQQYYTRAGVFDFDSEGWLVSKTSGLKVAGWVADKDGKLDPTGPLVPIQIPADHSLPAQPTTEVVLQGNLDASVETGTTFQRTVTVYDSLGRRHDVIVNFVKVDDNRWQWRAYRNGDYTGYRGVIRFTDTGEFRTATATQVQFDPGGGAAQVVFNIDFSRLTQYSSETELSVRSQNGFPPGALEEIRIDASGIITGIFSNGLTQTLAQVAVATFANPGGLEQAGETLFRASHNSGLPRTGPPGTGDRGVIAPGNVEMSNVDLSEEFTSMIITQRGFQANSRIITTSDEMLQELVNLKR